MKHTPAVVLVIGIFSVAACSSDSGPNGPSSAGSGGSNRDAASSSSGGGSGTSSSVSDGGSGGSGGSTASGGSGGSGGSTSSGGGASGASSDAGADERTSSGTSGGNDAAADGRGSNGGVRNDASADGSSLSGSEAGPVGMGQFDCTMNAADAAHHPGGAGEHEGEPFYGALVDTSPGANRALVGAVQTVPSLPASGFLKFTWPMSLVAGHTYELAVMSDTAKPPTHTCTAAARVWYWRIPAVTANVIRNFNADGQLVMNAYCDDFPKGPLP